MRLVLFIFCLFAWAVTALAQHEEVVTRVTEYCTKVPQERIYVHTDKACYAAGDTIWFRAHLVDAATNKPISRSRFMNIELYDRSADSLVERMMVRCDSDGVFANALLLSQKQHSGQYTLVAYTQWMRNFGADSFFYKPLLILNFNDHELHELTRTDRNDHELHELTRTDTSEQHHNEETVPSVAVSRQPHQQPHPQAYQRGSYIYIPTPAESSWSMAADRL